MTAALIAQMFNPLVGAGLCFCVSLPLMVLTLAAAVVTGGLYLTQLVTVVVWRRSAFDATDKKVTAAFGGLLAGGGLASLVSCLAGCGLCCGGFAAFVSSTSTPDFSGDTSKYNTTQRAGFTAILLSLGAGAAGLAGGVWTALAAATLGTAAGVGMLSLGGTEDELAE